MNKIISTLLAISAVCFLSCKENTPNKKDIVKKEILPTSLGEPNIDVDKLTTDFRNWWTYHSKNISLETDFIAVNETSTEITKLEFLESLVTGNFVPIKLKKNGVEQYYKLYKLTNDTDQSIRSTIINTSAVVLNRFKMVGQQFPDFNFVDLDGDTFDNQNSLGKVTVIKCWFINCVACVKEFPELNQYVSKQEGNKEIQFISLAIDGKSALQKFVKKKPFSYSIIPEQKEFMETALNVYEYPTHFIIDKNGIIEKVYTSADHLIQYLNNKY